MTFYSGFVNNPDVTPNMDVSWWELVNGGDDSDSSEPEPEP